MRSWKRFHRTSTGLILPLVLSGLIAVPPAVGASDDDLGFLTSILRNAAISDETRTDAAIRLLRLGGSEAHETLAEALRSGEEAQVAAVGRALAAGGVPPRLVADALVAALVDATPEFGALAGRTLARLGVAEVPSILGIADDPDASPETRIAAIRALGGFQHRVSVKALILMLDGATEPTEMAALTGSLFEITGIRLGGDKVRWQSWWSAVGSMPLDQAIGAASAGNQAQQLEAQRESIELLQARESRISERLQAVLGDWFLTLPELERETQLHLMLSDDLSVVRLFAANQVQRLLRNGVVPDGQTVTAAVNLLDDEVPELRILGAQLLAAIGIEGLPERLARKVTEEIDPRVASVMLDQIALRPCPDAFEPVLSRLDDEMTGAAASRALARMVDSRMVPSDWADRSRALVRALHSAMVTPATASLLVLVGEEEDLEFALRDLENESVAVRRASAFSFVARGRFDSVVALAHDEGVRPAAIRAFSLMPPTIGNLRGMLAIATEEAQAPTWRDALRRLAVRFNEGQMLEVDDLLAGDERVPVALRIDLLDAGMSGNDLESDPEFRGRLMDRFTGLLERGSRWQEIAKILGRPGVELAGALPRRLFRARMRIEDFEGAAAIEDSPNAWIDYLDGTVEIAPGGAATIVEEIRVRFEGRLDQDQLRRLEGITRKIALVDGSILDPELD